MQPSTAPTDASPPRGLDALSAADRAAWADLTQPGSPASFHLGHLLVYRGLVAAALGVLALALLRTAMLPAPRGLGEALAGLLLVLAAVTSPRLREIRAWREAVAGRPSFDALGAASRPR